MRVRVPLKALCIHILKTHIDVLVGGGGNTGLTTETTGDSLRHTISELHVVGLIVMCGDLIVIFAKF